MKLINCILRPGKVRWVDDKLNIKVSAPGLFNYDDDIELLPPIIPLFDIYTKPRLGDEVWILSSSDNHTQLYWFRKSTLDGIPDYVDPESGMVDVALCRNNNSNWSTIYFQDGEGIVLRNDDSLINIANDGSIILKNGNYENRTIHISNESISLGSPTKSSHPACYGDKVEDILEDIQMALNLIQQACKTNQMTLPISMALGNLPQQISDKIHDIISPNVSLD